MSKHLLVSNKGAPDHLFTVYKGIPNDGGRATIGRSHLIMMATVDIGAYANIICILSDFFCRVELSAYQKITTRPIHLTIVVPAAALGKWKEDDEDETVYRLWWMLQNFQDPGLGALISVYSSNNMKENEESPWAMNTLWHTKRVWNNPDSKLITIQHHGEYRHSGYSPVRLHIPESVDIITTVAKQKGYEINYVDYTTSIDTLYELMLKTRCHFSYAGSTGYFSAITRTPTVYFSRDTPDNTTLWNRWAGHERQTLQLDPNSGLLIKQEPPYYRTVNAADPLYFTNLESTVKAIL